MNEMTNWVDVELDEAIIRDGQRYGLVEERNGVYYMSKEGAQVIEEFIEKQWAMMPVCPKCERKAWLDKDYICKDCRYGPREEESKTLVTGY